MQPGTLSSFRDERVEFGRRLALGPGYRSRERDSLLEAPKRRFSVSKALAPPVLGGAPESQASVRDDTVIAPFVTVMMDAGNDRGILRDGEERL
jgi:hypothetical protein